MKNMWSKSLLCFSVGVLGLLSAPAVAQTQNQPQQEQTGKRELPNPERSARRETDRLKKDLNLTDKQYEKIYKLLLKEEKSRVENMTKGNMPSMPQGQRPPMPQGGMGGNGGMNPPMGPPPMGGGAPGGFKPNDNMQQQMEQKDKKMKKILSAEQYEKWKTLQAERKDNKPGERPDGNFPGAQTQKATDF